MSAVTTARTSRRRGVRATVIILSIVGICVLAAGVWVGVRGLLVKSEIEALQPLAQELQSAVASGDVDRVESLAPLFAQHAESAAGLTSDPVWGAAEAIPVAGANLAAVRIVAAGLAEISREIPGITDVLRGLSSPADGSLLPLQELKEASSTLESLDESVRDTQKQLDGIDSQALIGPVASGVEDLRSVVATMAPAIDTAARASAVLPDMLGLDGDRTILVMVQNPAELRTGGGITGAFAELHATQGSLSLTRQADSNDFAARTTDIVALPTDVTTVYSDVVGRFVQNASVPADFALTGELASAWWAELTGSSPNTVVSVDPYVLGAALTVTGPVDLPDGTQLSAENLAETLLERPYDTLSSDGQTELFQAAVDAVFARLTSGDVDVVGLVSALAQPIDEGRVSVWSADPVEDAEIAGNLAGPRARQDAAGDGAFAVYFNDATGAKMARFLDIDIDARVAGCSTPGMAEVVVSLEMASTAPADVETWPTSVTGGGHFGVGLGDIGTNVSVEGPRGSFAGAVVVKGESYPAATAVSDGRATSGARVNLSPAEVNQLEFHFTIPERQARDLTIVHTPLMGPSTVTIEGGTCS